MSSKVKDLDIKKRTYYFFNDIVNIKIFDPNKIKIDEKSYKNILIYYIELSCLHNKHVDKTLQIMDLA